MKNSHLIVIPARNEEACLGQTLTELLAVLPSHCRIAVGLNACNDGSRSICEGFPVFIGETGVPGYGHGCLAGIEAAAQNGYEPESYVFYAADGANRPQDALKLISEFDKSDGDCRFIMGLRKFSLKTWQQEFGRSLPNLILGTVCFFLGGEFFHDLAPLRLIEARLFREMELREKVWGWTIEAQLRAAQLGVKIQTVSVVERERTAGEQKVSGVSPLRSLKIGLKIAAAGFRTRFGNVSREQKESAS